MKRKHFCGPYDLEHGDAIDANNERFPAAWMKACWQNNPWGYVPEHNMDWRRELSLSWIAALDAQAANEPRQ